MARNIVICLDGTGNQVEANISNVLKLYRSVRKPTGKGRQQVAYYSPGVGTVGLKRPWSPLTDGTQLFLGLAFGYGLERTVLNAYRFIVDHYEERSVTRQSKRVTERDRIYLIGYSRGAYACRVLAGFIYQMGILEKTEVHLAGAAFQMYQQSVDKDHSVGVSEFNRITGPRRPAIDFMGLFDTVGSFITPRPDRFYVPSLKILPYTRENPGVRAMSEAASIDEARQMFRLEPWVEDQTFRRSEHSTRTAKQKFNRVWFAGYHGDVGGGNNRHTSSLSQHSFHWMVDEAKQYGMRFNNQMVEYVGGLEPYNPQTDYLYPEPDPLGRMHPSNNLFWAAQEWIPRRAHRREGQGRFREVRLGLYLPRREPRWVGDEPVLHPTVLERIQQDESYRPEGLEHLELFPPQE